MHTYITYIQTCILYMFIVYVVVCFSISVHSVYKGYKWLKQYKLVLPYMLPPNDKNGFNRMRKNFEHYPLPDKAVETPWILE